MFITEKQPKMFTQQAFDNARAYIFNHGRTLDQYLFKYHFEAEGAAPVLTALAHFQNVDGGFGHGLEPDVRTPASSAIATSHAFAIFRSVGAMGKNEMVKQAVAYCINSYDGEKQVWQIVPPEVEEAPHAPWWTFATLGFGGFLANPFASIVGHLNFYAELVPPEFLAEVTAVALQRLQGTDITEMHDFYCYLDLAKAHTLPLPQQDWVRSQLLQTVPKLVATDPEQWSGYNMKPLDVVSTPDHFLATAVTSQAVQSNLDYLIAQQLPNGSWPLAWSWEQVDTAAWQQAEQDWKGHVAVSNLQKLHAFGRIKISLGN